MNPATVIFLNGVSSAGKTSIAEVLQRTLPEPYLHVQLDSFEGMLPERYDEGGAFEWSILFPRLLSGFHHSIAALATDLLIPFQAYLVGVYCPLDELQRRERIRGDRYMGTAARQFDHVHRYGIYDVEVDTSRTNAETCAEQIMTYLNSHEPNAFPRLRAGT